MREREVKEPKNMDVVGVEWKGDVERYGRERLKGNGRRGQEERKVRGGCPGTKGA